MESFLCGKKKAKRNSCPFPLNGESTSSARKKKRVASESDAKETNDHSLKDFTCPICLEILIEPVVLPCHHELCLQCFNPYLENTSLSCPLCRIRISVWARRNRKNNTLVDLDQWNLIQKLFPDHVNRRLGILKDADRDLIVDDYVPQRVIALEGEIRKEYEEEMEKITLENAANFHADLDLVKHLQEEEENRKKREEADEVVAWDLQKAEMAKKGKTLKLPSEHRYKLSKLLSSPRKLRKYNKSPSNTLKLQTNGESNLLVEYI